MLNGLRLLAEMTQVHPHLICLFNTKAFSYDDFAKWIVETIAANVNILKSIQKPINATVSGILTALLGTNSRMKE
jgi:hypothetical protein